MHDSMLLPVTHRTDIESIFLVQPANGNCRSPLNQCPSLASCPFSKVHRPWHAMTFSSSHMRTSTIFWQTIPQSPLVPNSGNPFNGGMGGPHLSCASVTSFLCQHDPCICSGSQRAPHLQCRGGESGVMALWCAQVSIIIFLSQWATDVFFRRAVPTASL